MKKSPLNCISILLREKCDYCDFLSFRALSSVHEAYVQQALIREIKGPELLLYGLPGSKTYLSEEEPLLLEPSCISRIMETVFSCFQVEPEAEITIEANPGTLFRGKNGDMFTDSVGINRVSIGLQSAENTELKNAGKDPHI